MASLGCPRPPAHRLGGIRGLARIAGQALHAELVGGLAIAALSGQTQQAQPLLAGAKALATKQQEVAVEALYRHVAQGGHARVLALHPGPGPWLLHQPAPVQQAARQPVAQARAQGPEHQASSG